MLYRPRVTKLRQSQTGYISDYCDAQDVDAIQDTLEDRFHGFCQTEQPDSPSASCGWNERGSRDVKLESLRVAKVGRLRHWCV